ncbi:LPS export ABC transporter permease LptF [Pararhizobium sp.]|uniref:LPS export ABC transporter permease LptF n=1 Tax=Pararhizobium sp. TaxID=1977563 RepID=UPI002721D288|nr:LPS export ABC transporter permease LptF [Pararhizobium sp.]MDO9417576.1 LPS export ABC transporter permease LptF [Pararhizobium sp.]
MSILESYILKRVVQLFLTALLPVLAIIWTTQALGRINLVTDTGQSIGSFLKLATLILPTIIPIVLPFALVIGITQALTTMNNDSELTVMDAAGSSRLIVSRPITILAVVLSLASFGIDNFVEPQVRLAARHMVATAYADLLSTVIEEKNFRKLEDGLYVQVTERGNGRTLKGLFVADSRNPAAEMIYYSQRGAINESGTSLVMQDGEVHRRTPEGDVSIIRFDSYAFDLSDLSDKNGQPTLFPRDRDLPFLLNPDTNDQYYKNDPSEFTAELHRRFTEWMFPLVFGLISLVVVGGAHTTRQAQVHPMIPAMGLAFLIRWGSFYAANNVGVSSFFIGLMYAIPIGTIIACVHLLNSPASVVALSRFQTRLSIRLSHLRDRLVPVFRAPNRAKTGGAP